jgi:protein-L-isoaspartate(D-aspartate) O-methyltransferase
MTDAKPALNEVRRWFAEDLRVTCNLRDERVVEAFATVPREAFVGPGPWRLRHLVDGYWTTPDADPRRLYHNVLVALDETRGLNTGEPGLWARHFDRLEIAPGSRILQIGAGAGYFTAILAELAGAGGRVDGIEIDPELAATARRNLAAWPNAHIHAADASHPLDGQENSQWDVIVAFAGATTPLGWWLDSLADGGRLLLPMTSGWERGGFMLRLQRNGGGFSARSQGWVGFYPCAGARNEADRAALNRALDDSIGQAAVRSLRRDAHEADDSCWLHGDGWCLSKHELH